MSKVKSKASLKGVGIVIGLLYFTAVAIVAYWVSFFTGGEVMATQDNCYIIFQRNFPAPDGMIAFASILCAEGLRRRKEWATLWGLVAVGGLLFLGLIDISYNLWNNMYFNVSGEIGAEIIINIYCMGFAYFMMSYLWRNRKQLD